MKRVRTDLRDRRCLITGAAGGIGRAAAFAVAARGGRLLLTDVQAVPLEEAASAIRSAGGSVVDCAPADVRSHSEVAGLGERFGEVDVVMNVAGTSIWGPIERLTHEHWRLMVDVNLMGPIHVMETFVPPMVAAGRGGHVVNVSSAAGLIGLPWHAAYSAAKFGLRGVSEVLRFDLERHGIGVTLVCPGAVATPLVDTMQIVGVDRQHPAARGMAEDFVKRAHTPEQVAEMIVRGVERGTYLVFTSNDIRFAFLLQRVFPPAYALAMRALNRRMVSVARKAAA